MERLNLIAISLVSSGEDARGVVKYRVVNSFKLAKN